MNVLGTAKERWVAACFFIHGSEGARAKTKSEFKFQFLQCFVRLASIDPHGHHHQSAFHCLCYCCCCCRHCFSFGEPPVPPDTEKQRHKHMHRLWIEQVHTRAKMTIQIDQSDGWAQTTKTMPISIECVLIVPYVLTSVSFLPCECVLIFYYSGS